MSERLRPTDVPGQPGNIQNTRLIIDALMHHTSFSGTDAGELLFGLERLEAETEAEKILKAPQVQDARAVVSSMLKKGFIPKASANSFLECLKDPATAKVLKKYVLPVPNLAVISPDSQVAQKGIGRRRFLGGVLALGGLTLAGIGVKAIAEYLNPPPGGLYKKILDTPFAANELPQGWTQIRSYPDPGATFVLKDANVKGSIVGIDLQLQRSRDKSTIQLYILESFENAELLFKLRTQDTSEPINGIGNRALLNLDKKTRTGNLQVQFNNFVFGVYPGQNSKDPSLNEQQLLSIGEATVKYLARIGVTPGVK